MTERACFGVPVHSKPAQKCAGQRGGGAAFKVAAVTDGEVHREGLTGQARCSRNMFQRNGTLEKASGPTGARIERRGVRLTSTSQVTSPDACALEKAGDSGKTALAGRIGG